MNVKLLRQVAKHILAEPKRFAMWTWVQRKVANDDTFMADDGKQLKYAKCGTAACIGGWAIILSGIDPDKSGSIMREAGRLLDLDETAQVALFVESNWPDKFSEPYDDAKTQGKRARIAARRIEHFIKTGE